jgi:hypothetical protein
VRATVRGLVLAHAELINGGGSIALSVKAMNLLRLRHLRN